MGMQNTMIKKVLLCAPALTISGYGVHSRQIFTWLEDMGFDLKVKLLPWGTTPWYVNPELEEGLIGRIMKCSTPIEEGEKFDMAIHVQLPNEWNTDYAKINIGVTAGVETDICSEEWVKACLKMDHVIVPSQHTKQTFVNSANRYFIASRKIKNKIAVIPESYFDVDLDQIEPLDLNLNTPFNFLLVGTLTGNNPENDRKNIFYTVKWFCENFKDDPSVGLVLKISTGRSTVRDRENTTTIINQLVSEVRKSAFPRIHLLHGHMSQEEIMSLYKEKSIKCLISATRGEGFGLPLLEASACGLRTIATNWSSHVEFLEDDFLKIDYDLTPIHQTRIDNKIFIEGAKWANPKPSSFKKQLNDFRVNPNPPAPEFVKKIRDEYSIETIKRIYTDFFNKKILRGNQ